MWGIGDIALPFPPTELICTHPAANLFPALLQAFTNVQCFAFELIVQTGG